MDEAKMQPAAAAANHFFDGLFMFLPPICYKYVTTYYIAHYSNL
jgi:hypothetical protein